MKHVLFTHSLRSDWNHGNAHFLRGVVRALRRQGHEVDVHEPADGWSATNLVKDHGEAALQGYRDAYPDIDPHLYGPAGPDLDRALADADVVLVHEWTDPALVERIADRHARTDNQELYFLDSHHRALTSPAQIGALPLHAFTGVLAFGGGLRDRYEELGLAQDVHVWHEAADTDLFRPRDVPKEGDLVWVGNWGDGERGKELDEFLVGPVGRLGLDATVHGVRYPEKALEHLGSAGIRYGGWLPNHRAPEVFAAHRATVHVPRRPYLEELAGIPTIRMFEAFASGIPLVVARWRDTEGLFRDADYLRAEDGAEMEERLRFLMEEPDEARKMASRARARVLERHTCAHRVRELHDIVAQRRTASSDGLDIAFFGSSLLSNYWNGAATYYRGLLRALAAHGHRITFYEPDAFGRSDHRDMDPPTWATSVVYPATEEGVHDALRQARSADVVVKASGVGVHDGLLEREVPRLGPRAVYWDVDAPATLGALEAGEHPELREALPAYEAVFTYGGGPRVVKEFLAHGARSCTPIHNALDPSTHYPVAAEDAYKADLAFLGNRLPDREQRVADFFLHAAKSLPDHRFLLGGAGWEDVALPPNVHHVGHVPAHLHNAFNCSARAVLNINRDSMASYGHSPPTRVFEAAGAGACIITDAWDGIDAFLEPGKEVLVAQDGDDVVRHLQALDDPTTADPTAIGRAARKRVMREHTYAHRALEVDRRLRETRKVVA